MRALPEGFGPAGYAVTNEEIATVVNDTQELWSGVRRAEVMQQVRRLMREKGISGADLAERMGIHQPSVSRILSGKHNLTIDTLYRFADALEVPLTITFGLEDMRQKLLAEFGAVLLSDVPTDRIERLVAAARCLQEIRDKA